MQLYIIYIYILILLYFCSGCPEGDIRLVEGNTNLEGHVEICKDNSWGLVCQNSWGTSDARVVCRQLGFSTTGMCHIIIPSYFMGMHAWEKSKIIILASEFIF